MTEKLEEKNAELDSPVDRFVNCRYLDNKSLCNHPKVTRWSEQNRRCMVVMNNNVACLHIESEGELCKSHRMFPCGICGTKHYKDCQCYFCKDN